MTSKFFPPVAAVLAALSAVAIGPAAALHPDGHDFGPARAPVRELTRELGPRVGAAIPHDLQLAAGEKNFSELAGPKGMALFFVRSVDWCPYCKAQALSIDAARAEFEKRGLSVVFVSYDSPEKQKEFAAGKKVSVTLLSDPKSEIIDAFGLRNEKHASGRFAGIPHPAAFIVKPDKTIAAKLFEADYATNDKSYVNRPEVGAVLAAADAAFPAK